MNSHMFLHTDRFCLTHTLWIPSQFLAKGLVLPKHPLPSPGLWPVALPRWRLEAAHACCMQPSARPPVAGHASASTAPVMCCHWHDLSIKWQFLGGTYGTPHLAGFESTFFFRENAGKLSVFPATQYINISTSQCSLNGQGLISSGNLFKGVIPCYTIIPVKCSVVPLVSGLLPIPAGNIFHCR